LLTCSLNLYEINKIKQELNNINAILNDYIGDHGPYSHIENFASTTNIILEANGKTIRFSQMMAGMLGNTSKLNIGVTHNALDFFLQIQ
jgi:hypothetical protein